MLMLPSCVKEIPRFDWSIQSYAQVGSGCGSVGKAVASDTRGLRFESSHRQKFIYILNICLLSTVYWKDENKEKEAGDGPFFFKKVMLKYNLQTPKQRKRAVKGICPTGRTLESEFEKGV